MGGTLKGENFAAGELPGVVTPLKSGQSVRGVFGIQGKERFQWDGVTLLMPSTTEFDSFHVVVVGYDVVPGAGCNGAAENPVSAPGFVCIYPLITSGVSNMLGWGARCSCGDPTATNDGSKFGFMVQIYGIDNNPAINTASGVWVYTAP